GIGKLIILGFGAQRQVQAESLAAAFEARRLKGMEQIKVLLRQVRKTDQRIDGTEAGADRHEAGALFIDGDNEVLFAGRNLGRLRARIDLGEVIHAFEAMFAVLDAEHVEGLARGDGEFTADDLVFGFGVAMNFNFFDIRFFAFIDLEIQVHGPGLGIGDAGDIEAAPRGDIDVAFGAVEILDVLGILAQPAGLEHVADVHRQTVGAEFALLALEFVDDFQAVCEVAGAEQFIAGKLDGADPVLRAFINQEANNHRPGRRIKELNLLDIEVQVAVFAIEVEQRLLVLDELLVLEVTVPGDPGEHP